MRQHFDIDEFDTVATSFICSRFNVVEVKFVAMTVHAGKSLVIPAAPIGGPLAPRRADADDVEEDDIIAMEVKRFVRSVPAAPVAAPPPPFVLPTDALFRLDGTS